MSEEQENNNSTAWYMKPKFWIVIVGIFLLWIPGINLLVISMGFLYVVVMIFGKSKRITCPKCDSDDINLIKPTLIEQNIAIWQRVKTRTLNACRSCGFSWEDR